MKLSDLGQRDEEVASGGADQVLDFAFLVALPWRAEEAGEDVVGAKGDEARPAPRERALEKPASGSSSVSSEDSSHQRRRIVEGDPSGHPLEESESLGHAFEKGFLTLVGERHQERKLRVAQPQRADVDGRERAAENRLGLVEVGLGIVAGLVGEDQHRLLDPGTVGDWPMVTDVGANGALGTDEAVLVA